MATISHMGLASTDLVSLSGAAFTTCNDMLWLQLHGCCCVAALPSDTKILLG